MPSMISIAKTIFLKAISIKLMMAKRINTVFVNLFNGLFSEINVFFISELMLKVLRADIRART